MERVGQIIDVLVMIQDNHKKMNERNKNRPDNLINLHLIQAKISSVDSLQMINRCFFLWISSNSWELSVCLGSCILKLVECIKFWVRLRTIKYCQITHTSHAYIKPSGGPHYCSYIHGGEEQAMRRYLQPLEWRASSFNKRTGVNVWFETGQMDAQFSVFR